MITFFSQGRGLVTAVESATELTPDDIERLQWLLDGARHVASGRVGGIFVGPRREMVTPWSTNAVEITRNAGIEGITRMEQYKRVGRGTEPQYDPMLQSVYRTLDSRIFRLQRTPEAVVHISDIARYNEREGLALSHDEVKYLEQLSAKLGRPLTDSEVFGFSQVNSEHCRHKIFNGRFIIDGREQEQSLFQMIKGTSKANPGRLVSAYKDNVAFVTGPEVDMFAPDRADVPGTFTVKRVPSVLSLKAETHNFPTTVEPFNGASTGSGGEIRDRLGGGRASLPLAGTAVYMTSYPRLPHNLRPYELMMNPRVWLYQTPADILIKASNGASDFGNKFGQPLICGSLLTFEHDEQGKLWAYDKVIMLAGGVGWALERDAIKGVPEPGQAVVVMGGDNYRIGMGGGAVSSVDTGRYAGAIELNAVQRANPEMQKRVSNVIRALAESADNPIVSIHDHGAGGHLNALSELVEATGGTISIDALPVGDVTLSDKEIIGNESQERMGIVIRHEDVERVRQIAERENAPLYVVGETTGDHRFTFTREGGESPIDLEMADMIGNPPKTVIQDRTTRRRYEDAETTPERIAEYVEAVLNTEAVACKDWLTNKVDRSVTGRVARQQCQGVLQLPLSDCGVVALDYTGTAGIATSIGHAPQASLVDAAAASRLAIAEALTNIVGANLNGGLAAISLSANWMWPCKNTGEDAALYAAVKSCADYATQLGINIPTGKDSLSMTQKYGNTTVTAPGTVIISAAGEVSNVRLTVSPVLNAEARDTRLLYIDMSDGSRALGGSALLQTLGAVGRKVPSPAPADRFAATFNAVQALVADGSLIAAHDVSAGGLITTLLEMTFANTRGGVNLDLDTFGDADTVALLFSESPALVVQVSRRALSHVKMVLNTAGAQVYDIGTTCTERRLAIHHGDLNERLSVENMRMAWYRASHALDILQSGRRCADERMRNFARQPLRWQMPAAWDGSLAARELTLSRTTPTGIRAAIIREKGVNGDREMAYSLHLAGFDVRDVHMTDLMSGRETLDDVRMIVFCGGFSNSDVLGSARGWAATFRYNDNARRALERFYARPDTLSLGICNGCQLMITLGLVNPEHERPTRMRHNRSMKFESNFVNLDIPRDTNAVMLQPLRGTRLGIWVAHGEGRFELPMPNDSYNVAVRYSYVGYPANPNGSPHGIAGLCSADGRHLAMMPHLERAIFPWQCGWYPRVHSTDEVTPWIDAFIAARRWCEAHS